MKPSMIRKPPFASAAVYLLPILFFLSACASKPLNPWSTDSPPHALVPVADAGVNDGQGRFREVY